MMRETWRNPGKGRPKPIAANRLTSSRASRLRPPRVVSGFELRRRFIQLPGDLAEKLRRAALGLGSDLLFQVLAQAGEFFLHAAAKLFKFVHGIRAPNCAARFRYYRRNVAERPDRFAWEPASQLRFCKASYGASSCRFFCMRVCSTSE